MSSSTIVAIFPAGPQAKRSIARRAYLYFGTGAALIACGSSALIAITASASAPPPVLLTLAAGIGVLGGIGLVAGIVTLARLQMPIQVEVTPHRLIWREGNRFASLEFDEVVRVEMLRQGVSMSTGIVVYYPIVRFIEGDGEMMEFEVSFDDRGYRHLARFNTQGLTGAVLPYLGDSTVIAPSVVEFVRSGLVDIETLPDR